MKLATPEELDKLLTVTNPKGWIALIGLTAIIITITLWAIFGSLVTTLPTSGVLVRPAGIQEILSDSAGRITEINVRAGDSVKVGQPLAKILTAQGVESPVYSRNDGVISDILVEADTLVAAQTQLIRLEVVSLPLQALLLVPLSDGKRLSPGLQVQLTPSSVGVSGNGYLLGKISSISQLPTTQEKVRSLFKSRELTGALLNSGPALEVWVELENPSTPGIFRWSSGNNPANLLSSGTLCKADIVLSEQSPLTLVLPILKEQKGS